jgi:hypothetical protein
MSNGARHTWGILAGLVLTAALAGLLIFGSYRLQHGYAIQFNQQDKWIGGGLLAAAALVFALLASSRLSPLGSLIGGLVLTGAGVLFFISQKTTADLINRFPLKQQRVTLAGLEEEGFLLFAGLALLVSSCFPSRWRARDDDDDYDSGYEYGVQESSSAYGERRATTEPVIGGRHARDDSSASGAYGTRPDSQTLYDPHQTSYDAQQTGYDPSSQTSYDSSRTSYDTPLYEQQRQQPFAGRSPFSPPDESGGTQEMHRPD